MQVHEIFKKTSVSLHLWQFKITVHIISHTFLKNQMTDGTGLPHKAFTVFVLFGFW